VAGLDAETDAPCVTRARPLDDRGDETAADAAAAQLRGDPHPDQVNRARIIRDEAADDGVESPVPLHRERGAGLVRGGPLLPDLVREGLLAGECGRVR